MGPNACLKDLLQGVDRQLYNPESKAFQYSQNGTQIENLHPFE
jgi:hypothetical protein